MSIRFRREEGILFIDMMNCFSDGKRLSEIRRELCDVCREINSECGIYVVVLKGIASKEFEPMHLLSSGTKGRDKKFFSLGELVSGLDPPVLVEMHGDIISEGLELALACDIRIATDTTHFGLPHIMEGLIPWDGGTQRLARIVGKFKAMEMILTGETINAQEAHRIGLVHRIVPKADLVTAVMNMAQTMASKGPIALRYAKEAINKGMDLTLDQGLRLEADLYFLLHTTMDRTEGVKAFQEKRAPEFEER